MYEIDDNNLWGEYEHCVDDKGRIVIPMEFRHGLGDEFVLTRGPDRAILVLPAEAWLEIERRLATAALSAGGGVLQRMLGGRTNVRMDPQCRLAIPKHLREWAQIDQSHTVVIIGQGRKCEIWSKHLWDDYNRNFTYDKVVEAADAAGLAGLLR